MIGPVCTGSTDKSSEDKHCLASR